MSHLDTYLASYEFNRGRTLALLDAIEKLPDPQAALSYRPGPGRAHIGWQLMHLAVAEDAFASDRLCPDKQVTWPDLYPRFKGGSTPDDNDVPSLSQIREALAASRARLIETLRQWDAGQYTEPTESMQQRGWSFATVLNILGWHEAHHQGQCHLTLNLYNASGQSPS